MMIFPGNTHHDNNVLKQTFEFLVERVIYVRVQIPVQNSGPRYESHHVLKALHRPEHQVFGVGVQVSRVDDGFENSN